MRSCAEPGLPRRRKHFQTVLSSTGSVNVTQGPGAPRLPPRLTRFLSEALNKI